MLPQRSGYSSKGLCIDSCGVDGKGVLSLGQPPIPDSLRGACGGHSPIVLTRHRCNTSQTRFRRPFSLQHGTVAFPEQQSFPLPDTRHASVSNQNLDVSSLAGKAPGSLSSMPSHKIRRNAIMAPEPIRHRERKSQLRKRESPTGLLHSSQPQIDTMSCSENLIERYPYFDYNSSKERLPMSHLGSDAAVKQENVLADDTRQLRISTDKQYPGVSPRGPTGVHPYYDSDIFTQSPILSTTHPLGPCYSNASAFLTSNPPSANDLFPSPHFSNSGSASPWQSDDAFGASGLPYTPTINSQDTVGGWSPVPPRIAEVQTPQSLDLSPAPGKPLQCFDDQNDILEDNFAQYGHLFDVSNAADSLFPPSTIYPVGPAIFDQRSPTYAYSNSPSSIPEEFPKLSQPNTPQVQYGLNSPSLSPSVRMTPSTPSIPQPAKPARRVGSSKRLSTPFSNGSSPASSAGEVQLNRTSSPKRSSPPISFVNFTPKDGHKILSGVAPSGSSKTKARRESEARERRRKLNEAAMRAVRQAGGDIGALETAFG